MKPELVKFLYIMLAFACFHPAVGSAGALLLGIAFALLLENPYPARSKTWSGYLLQISVVGLGGAMNIHEVMRVGVHGIGYTFIGISLTLILSFLLGKLLKVSANATTLIGSGTAICGGSAIAATAPVIEASPEDISISLITVFLLNSVALFLFPPIGHYFHLSQDQFGLWAALAIHDTSSVVGASMQYGAKALEVATAVKLARTLWIIPMVMIIGFYRSRSSRTSLMKVKKPWFILGFLLLAVIITYDPILHPAGKVIANGARRLLVVTLFLIGSSLNRKAIQAVGIKPLLLGVILWACIASATLAAILQHDF
jgi:uncharacterized integral membrane protein (TIGR00698 family)